MTSTWVTVSAQDVATFMDPAILASMNKNNSSALQNVLDTLVDEVRGHIVRSNRAPLSLTPKSIPPEGKRHVIALALNAMASSTPQLAMYCETKSFERRVNWAENWLAETQNGDVSWPVDPDSANMPTGTMWGDQTAVIGVQQVFPILNSGGSGYVIGDVLYASGGYQAIGVLASFTVTSIDSSGQVIGVSLTNTGNYTTPPSSPNAVTGGTGTGCQLTLITGNVQAARIDMTTDGAWSAPYLST